MRQAETLEFRSIVNRVLRENNTMVIKTYTDTTPGDRAKNSDRRIVTFWVGYGFNESKVLKSIREWMLLAGIEADLRITRGYLRGTCVLSKSNTAQ
jgi:hypothetical protein